MRRLYVGLVAAAIAVFVPTWAFAGNQEVAEQIAAALKDSGQLHGYKVGVKFQDGTAWLKGQVANRDQMQSAMQVVFAVPGVTRVVNQLTLASDGSAAGPAAKAETPKQADRLVTTFASTSTPQVATTGLQEPTLAPKSEKMASQASAEAVIPKAPKPMPMPYAQAPLPMANGQPAPQPAMAIPAGAAPMRYDQPNMPNYSWPSYAAYPNYGAVTYPKQYSPTAWPYIGPFYPYPQVPLGWRKVTLEWHDGWWNLDFDDGTAKGPFSGLFRPARRKY
jgi:hypothetical protein